MLTSPTVLAKVDERFPETDAVKLHQLLDPETKGLIPRPEATRILEDAITVACERQFITITDSQKNSQLDSSPATSSLATSDEYDADARRKRMRLELLNDLRCQSPGHCTDSIV